MARIFVSYANVDREFAWSIAENLSKHGHRILSLGIEPGSTIVDRRILELSHADAVVVVLSDASTKSLSVNAELGAARAFESKLLIPILIDDVPISSWIAGIPCIRAAGQDTDQIILQIEDALHRRSARRAKERGLLVSTLFSAFTAILGALTSFIVSGIGARTLPVLLRVHWSVWVCSVPTLYAVSCYINDRLPGEGKILPRWLSVPVWTQLRGFGDKRVARISYFALVIIPTVAYFLVENPFKYPVLSEIALPTGVRLTFFASWFFSIALIIFVAGCPKQFRSSTPLENARTVNLVIHESPKSNINIESAREVEDPALDSLMLELRAACFLFYVLGIAVSAIVLFRAAWFVTQV